MNRKIFLSCLSIVAALTLTTGTAFAAFTTTAVATAATYTTTTPGLEIGAYGYRGPTIPGPHITGLVPGVPTDPVAFILINDDPSSGGDLTVSLTTPFTSENSLSGEDMTITVNCGGEDITDTYSGWIFNGHVLGVVPHGEGTLNCTMTAMLNAGVGNQDIGKSAVFDATFTGTAGQ